MILQLDSLDATISLAARIAHVSEVGDVITLRGNLGAGKSEFARAFIKSLAGQDTIVPSPTFTLLEQYLTPRGLVSHFDLYRIDDPVELVELGFEEALSNSICLIEWPERLGGAILDRLLQIEIQAHPLTEVRTVGLNPDATWVERIQTVFASSV